MASATLNSPQKISGWVLKDVLLQLEAVLSIAQTITTADSTQVSPTTGSANENDQASEVYHHMKAQVERALPMLYKWLVNFMKAEDLPDVVRCLMHLYNSNTKKNVEPEQKSENGKKSKSKTKVQWDIKDSLALIPEDADSQAEVRVDLSVPSILMKTMLVALNSAGGDKTTKESETKATIHPLYNVPKEVFGFLFDVLQSSQTLSTRDSVGRCLGLLSESHFKDVTGTFRTALYKILSIKSAAWSEENHRDFCIMMWASSFLAFGKSAESLKATTEFLTMLSKKLPKAPKAIYPVVCAALGQIIPCTFLLDYKDDPWKEWNTLVMKKSGLLQQLTQAIDSLYSASEKWARKDDVTWNYVQSFQCRTICAHRDFSFYSSKSFIKHLLSSFKNENRRLVTLQLLVDYTRNLQAAVIEKSLDRFSKQMKAVFATIFGTKRTAIPQDQLDLMCKLLVVVGQRHLMFFVNDVFVVYCGQKSVSTVQKSCFFTAVAKLAGLEECCI